MQRMVFIQKLHKQETVGLTAIRHSSAANSLNAVTHHADTIRRKSAWVLSIFVTVSAEKDWLYRVSNLWKTHLG